MRALIVVLFAAAAVSAGAQTVANTYNVLHPIMKDPNHRNAPTSLDRNHPLDSDQQDKTSQRSAAAAKVAAKPAATPAAPAAPAPIVPKIDPSLTASAIKTIGTISGIKGKMDVKNNGSKAATPQAQFAVCNSKGFQIGSVTKSGTELEPGESGQIEVLATNTSAVDLKLMKLSIGSGH
jgi:hypothetical protein